MPIQTLDSEFVPSVAKSFPLSALKSAAVGIDAHYFLDQHLTQPSTKEPLLTALGGLPFSLKANIERELDVFKANDVTLVFVFEGLNFGAQAQAGGPRPPVNKLDHAWELYDTQQADQVVDAFSNSGTVDPKTLYRFLQTILEDRGIDWMVAPYSASAQLSYLEKLPTQYIDVIYGSTELLFFDTEKFITRFEPEKGSFSWLTLQACQNEIGAVSKDVFVDACLLLGSPFLPTFPLLGDSFPSRPHDIREAVSILHGVNRDVVALCEHYRDDPRIRDSRYAEQYQRAVMTIKHHVILEESGHCRQLNAARTPNDLHTLIGQRLPDEVYYYFNQGIISSQIPDALTSGEFFVPYPVGIAERDSYRELAGTKLTSLRTQALGLLSNSLHRFYQKKNITVRLWDEETSDRVISLGETNFKETVSSWKVKTDQLPEKLKTTQSSAASLLAFAVDSAADADFTSKSFATKESKSLVTKEEILSNAMWRFLQLRGYIDDKHQLTAWGKALQEALKDLKPGEKMDEDVFVGIELLRLGQLTSADLFPNVTGGPMNGSNDDRKYALLASRVGCIGKIGHKDIGYAGPLNRQHLSYRAMVSAVRKSLRDLLEVILLTLFLNNDVNRTYQKLGELSLSLPFTDDNDCALGIAVLTYLDHVALQDDSSSPTAKAASKAKGGSEWFLHITSFEDNLEKAFRLWDHIYIASQAAGKDFKDAAYFKAANDWLSGRR